MTAPVGSRWSLPTKMGLLAAVTLGLAGGVIAVLVDADRGELLAIALVMVIPVAMVYGTTRFIVGRVTVPVVAAYRRLAAGDFTAELPTATAGRDFLGVRDGFRAMADALERTLAEVRGADRERRRLFADLAHELATPTTTLIGIAAAVRAGTGDRDRLLELLERECARLERLIADVRELAALDDPEVGLERSSCELGALTAAAIEPLRVAHDGAPALTVVVAELAAVVDGGRIEQVVTNLVGNALRHAGGAAVEVVVAADGADAVLRVDDAGPGVPDDRLGDLGRRLVRIDRSRSRDSGGHGLGLSIVRAIVARHGGTITFARSRLGGLGVEVRLPRAAARGGA